MASAGASIGSLLCGAITQAISWHWIFSAHLPIGCAIRGSLLRGRLTVIKDLTSARGSTCAGAAPVTASLMLLVYTIVKASDDGWTSAHTLGFGSAAVALLAAFILREARTQTPLMPLRIFRSRAVSGANTVQALMVSGLFGMFFLGTLFMQRVLGYGPIEHGFS